MRTKRGPSWDTTVGIREQAEWIEHAQFADKLVKDGRILLGGPIEDPDPDVVALVAMELPEASSVHEIFADDPWVRSGVLSVKDIRPWRIWLRPRARDIDTADLGDEK